MTKLCLFSQSFENIQRISSYLIDNDNCTLIINNKYLFNLPLISLSYLSTKFTEELINDCTKRIFNVSIDQKYITDDLINKLSRLFQLEEIEIENLNEILFFSHIGKEIQCNLFSFLLENYQNELIDGNELSLQNTLILLIEKYQNNSNYEKELKFIAKNFTKIVENENILSILTSYNNNNDIFDCILSSDALRIKDEDFLLNFVLNLAKKSPEYFYLIQNVHLEYCSIVCVDSLLSFAKSNLCNNHSLECLFECLRRRLLQEKIPVENIEDNNRYEKNDSNNNNIQKKKEEDVIEFTFNNGFLRKEKAKNNVIIECSSILNSFIDPYNVLTDNNSCYSSKNKQNSWILARLTNGESFNIKGYIIQARSDITNGDFPKNWKLEGYTVDNQPILLDQHSNEPFAKSETKSFKIDSCNQKITKIKLTQTGPNTRDSNYFELRCFDIFATF